MITSLCTYHIGMLKTINDLLKMLKMQSMESEQEDSIYYIPIFRNFKSCDNEMHVWGTGSLHSISKTWGPTVSGKNVSKWKMNNECRFTLEHLTLNEWIYDVNAYVCHDLFCHVTYCSHPYEWLVLMQGVQKSNSSYWIYLLGFFTPVHLILGDTESRHMLKYIALRIKVGKGYIRWCNHLLCLHLLHCLWILNILV